MNLIRVFLFFIFCSPGFIFGQQKDSIFLDVKLDTITGSLQVNQKFRLINHSPKTLNYIYLHAWSNAYTGRLTELNKVKLQNRKSVLHFSEKEDRGWISEPLFTDENSNPVDFSFEEREFIKLELGKSWKKNDTVIFYASYNIKIPTDKISRYGKSADEDYLLKYFFLQPAIMNSNGKWILQHYKDYEEPIGHPSSYRLKIDLPENYYIYSDLDKNEGIWSGDDIEFFRLFLTRDTNKIHIFKNPENGLEVQFAYEINEEDKVLIDSLLPAQIRFLREHLGDLPVDKLLISSKTKKEQNFFGVDDMDLKIFKLKPFTDAERNALILFQLLSYEYTDRLFLTDKTKDHWLKNGLMYYLMMKYTDVYFSDLKLTGQLTDNFKLLGMRPLNFFNAAKLKMNERYKILFLYVAIQGYDQPINTDFDEFSQLNQMVVSGFKTGVTFYYIDKFLGGNNFQKIVSEFSSDNCGNQISQLDFRNYLIEKSNQDLSWFFDDFIDKNDRINFKLLSATKDGENLKVKIKNKTGFQGPFQLVGIKDGVVTETQWYQNSANKFTVIFPDGDYDNLALNPDFIFPEVVERDNYMRNRGLFRNMKKPQFKLYPDIENPKYAQIFFNPQIRWNNYDKFLIGGRFQNQSIIKKPFRWSVSPKWSTGQKKLTGSAGIQNTFFPTQSFIRSLVVGFNTQYEHYDDNLSYLKWSAFSKIEIKKDYRSNLNSGFIVSFDHLNKKLPNGVPKTNQDKYGLWNFTFYYSKPDYIHDFSTSATLQSSDSFNKIFAEAYYRWRFSSGKQLGVRIFSGIFLNNKSDSDYFNFGLSHVSDYAFNLSLLGRSEKTGVLSQQFILSEAGFKSYFDKTVNNWVNALNVEFPVWKMLYLYADAAVYNNNGGGSHFLYDSGLKIKLIPDFLELYLPVQSTLGFEPGMDKYGQRIRFTINLNFNSIINHLRRGWY